MRKIVIIATTLLLILFLSVQAPVSYQQNQTYADEQNEDFECMADNPWACFRELPADASGCDSWRLCFKKCTDELGGSTCYKLCQLKYLSNNPGCACEYCDYLQDDQCNQ